MKSFKPFVHYILLGVSLLCLSINSANAATLWDNGEQNGEGAWDLTETIADDFWLTSAADIGFIDVWLVAGESNLASVVSSLFVDFTTYTTSEPYVPETPLEQVSATIDGSSQQFIASGLSWAGDETIGTIWNDVSAYKVTLDVSGVSLAAGLYSMQIGSNLTSSGEAGWMWSDVSALADGFTLTPLFDGSDGNILPPDALAFKLYDNNGDEVGKLLATPVPAAIWLFGTALIGFVGMSRRTKVS